MIVKSRSSIGTIQSIKGSGVDRVKVILDIAFESQMSNMHNAGMYTGNVQLTINGNWIEQFELNSVLKTNADGESFYHIYEDIPGEDLKKKFYAQYEVVLTDPVTELFKNDLVNEFRLTVRSKQDFIRIREHS